MSTPQGGLLPSNYSRIWVRGQFIDLAGNSMRGTVSFTATPAVLLDRGTKHIISNKRFDSVLLDNTGKFAIELPATNDPDIIPTGWTYIVKEPTGRSYHMVVPWDTPRLDAPGDALDGERVIELIDIVPSPSASGGTVQLMKGRGIESVEIDDSGGMVVHYDDLSSSASLPVGAGPDTVTDWTIRTPGSIAPGVTDDFGRPFEYLNRGVQDTYTTVQANRLDFVPVGDGPRQAVYFNQELADPVGKLGMQWGYAGGTTGGSLCLAVWDQVALQSPSTVNSRCHLTVWPTGWDYSVFENGAYSNIATGTFSPSLPQLTKLHTEVTFAGDVAIILLPNGQVQRLFDPRIGRIPGTVAGWEFYKDNTAPVFYQAFYSMYAYKAKPWPLT